MQLVHSYSKYTRELLKLSSRKKSIKTILARSGVIDC